MVFEFFLHVDGLSFLYFKFMFNFSDKPYLEITIYPSDTENEENKKSLRIDLITIFTKDVS